MRKQVLLMFGCILLSGSMSAYGSTGARLQSKAATQRNPTPHPVPSVKRAIVEAIELSKGRNLFNRLDKDSDPEDDILFYKSVEILGAKQPNGSVKVVFSLPTSDVIVSEGRLSTKKLFEVTFTRAGVASKSYVEKPQSPQQPSQSGPMEKQETKFRKAIIVVCSRLPNQNKMEFAVRVSAERKQDDLSVFVQRVPYTPGAHTLYILSTKFKIVRTLPGL